jgi:hypothetical protein
MPAVRYSRVLGVVLVALRAMRPRSKVDPRIAALHVLSVSYRLKVIGVDAAPDAAKMVKLKTVRDWSALQFVDDAVGKPIRRPPTRTDRAAPNAAISLVAKIADQNPASGEWNRNDKSVKEIKRVHG